jgi:hypothetical protein
MVHKHEHTRHAVFVDWYDFNAGLKRIWFGAWQQNNCCIYSKLTGNPYVRCSSLVSSAALSNGACGIGTNCQDTRHHAESSSQKRIMMQLGHAEHFG